MKSNSQTKAGDHNCYECGHPVALSARQPTVIRIVVRTAQGERELCRSCWSDDVRTER